MKKFLSIIAAVVIGFASAASAATYTNDNIGGTAGFPAHQNTKAFVLEASVDFADINVTTNDVVQAISIPANTWVQFVNAEVVSASTTNVGANHSITVGDGSDADGWVASLALITAGTDASSVPLRQTLTNTTGIAVTTASPAYGWGKVYTAADTIDLTSNGAQTDGVVRVRAVVFDVSNTE